MQNTMKAVETVVQVSNNLLIQNTSQKYQVYKA